MTKTSLAFALFFVTVPAFAAVTVSAPANGATVGTSFALAATASPCSSQPVLSMGYSIDSGATTIIHSNPITATVSSPLGNHVLHVKSWGNGGAACTTNVNIIVVQNPGGQGTTTDVTVASPVQGATVMSPFSITASGTLCVGQPISAFGYSLDSGATTLVNGTSISVSLATTAGPHTVHVKSWGNSGSACNTDIPVNVTLPITSPTIPDNAIVVKDFQKLSTWKGVFDTGTSGSATGTTAIVADPSLSGFGRQFAMTYSRYGGLRFSSTIDNDGAATNFVMDTMIYVAAPSTQLANVEVDLNQVMNNGQTVIFGFQCDGWSHTWDYTANIGTPTSPNTTWLHSTQSCDPRKWTTNAWHHLQISYSRDSAGNATYQSVWFDGFQQDLNVTVNSAFALGWQKGNLVVNVQLDGSMSTTGSATIYTDQMTLYRW